MKHRILSSALCLAASLSMVGCLGSNSTPAPAPAQVAAPISLSTSSTASTTALDAGMAKIKNDLAKVGKGVVLDLESTQGQTFLKDLGQSASSVTLAVLGEGTNIPADVNAAEALAGTFEAYSTLPTTSSNLAQIAQVNAGASQSAAKLAPAIVSLADQASSATGLSKTVILQKLASGVYNATTAKTAP